MKRCAIIAAETALGLVMVGWVLAPETFPVEGILVPGLWAAYTLDPALSPDTIGIGGVRGFLLVTAVAGTAWFAATFVVAAMGRRLVRFVRSCQR